MTEYQKTYIELKKQFVATNEGPDSVRALYTFKEELEQSEDQQAKEVLVDVYDLLDFKKDAYELLCQIGNRSDKKTLKRLGTLKDYAENWGNHYALPKPKTPEEKQKEKERQAQLGLPAFRYHPNPLETGAFGMPLALCCWWLPVIHTRNRCLSPWRRTGTSGSIP